MQKARVLFSDFYKYQAGTGLDLNGISDDPLFVDASSTRLSSAIAQHKYRRWRFSDDDDKFRQWDAGTGSGLAVFLRRLRYCAGDLVQVGANSPVRITKVDRAAKTALERVSPGNQGWCRSYPYGFGSGHGCVPGTGLLSVYGDDGVCWR
ncbi:MAG: hypothetical protein R3C68_09045 [Myxococcota bacterium]